MKRITILSAVAALGLLLGACAGNRPQMYAGGFEGVYHSSQPAVYQETEETGYNGGNYRRRGEPRCTIPGSVYAKEIGECVLKVRDQARVDREVPDAHLDHDPRCAGHPSGYTFSTPITGPNGMQGLVRRRCR